MALTDPPATADLTDGDKLSNAWSQWFNDLLIEVNALRTENTDLKARVATLEGS